MTRTIFTTFVFAGLAAWAAGQGPPPGEAAGERMATFARNKNLVEDLVARGVELANATNPMARAEACRKATADLGAGLRAAVADDDAGRVAEVTDHLGLVVREALLPAIAEAAAAVPPQSPDAARLLAIKREAAADLDRTAADLPAAGKLADSARVKDARIKLRDAAAQLK